MHDTTKGKASNGRHLPPAGETARSPASRATPLDANGTAIPKPRAGRSAGQQGQLPHHDALWKAMHTYLRQHHAAICRVWFEQIRPLGIVDGAIDLRAGTRFEREALRATCSGAFHEAARAVSGLLLGVRFLGPDDPWTGPLSAHSPEITVVAGAGARATPPAPQPSPTPQRTRVTFHEQPGFDRLALNPDYSFEQFVAGPNNHLAHAAAEGVASEPGTRYSPLFIHGGVGLGKTHLLHATAQRILECNQSCRLLYISCEAFISRYVHATRTGGLDEFRRQFRSVEVLIVDDIHFLNKRDQSQEEFFHTFNALHELRRQIILSCDAAPEDVPALEERLVSRFRSGLVVRVDPPNFETRIEIIHRKAALRGIEMPKEVAELVASRLQGNIRELEGAVVRLQVQALVEQTAITPALAHRALGEIAPKAVPAKPTIQQVAAVVASHYDVRVTDLQGKVRQRSIALPRHITMYLARKTTDLSLVEIGGYLGGRDHTTVLHALRTIEERAASEPDFAATLQSLRDRVEVERAQ